MANSTKIRGITIELNADTAGIMDGIKDLNASLSKTDKSLRDVDKLLKFDPSSTTLLAQQQEYLGQAIEQTEEKLRKQKELLESMKNADNAEETVEQQRALEREIEATTQKLEDYKGRLNQADGALHEYGEETEDASQKTLSMGDIIKANLASDLIISAVRKLADGIKEVATSAMEVGMSFESSMSQVAATMGMTAAEIQGGSQAYTMLANAAKEAGQTTMFTASQAAEALNYLALAGYDAEKAAATLPKVLTLAAAGGMDLAYASDLVTDSMSALGMETDELDNYIDEMTVTAQKANTSVAQLGEATLVCGGTVSLTGQSIETMNTELGILANNGIKGAEGGTHLRNVLLALAAPTDKAAQELERLGITITDNVTGNMRDLNDIMSDLNFVLGDMGGTEKTEVIAKIFRKTDIAAVNALLKGTGEEFNHLNAEIQDCAGSADRMADTMMDNLQGKITILQSALEGLGVSFYEIFDDDAKMAVESATEAVGRLQEALTHGELGVSVNELAEALGNLAADVIADLEDALPKIIDGATWFVENLPVIVDLIQGVAAGFVAYETATKLATIATVAFGVALEATPIGLAVGAVAGLIVGFKELAETFDSIDPKVESFARHATGIADKTHNMAESSDELVSKWQAQSKLADDLKNRLAELQNKTSLTAEEQREEADIVNQLNAIIPDLNMKIDEQGNIISDATGKWEDYIDAQIKQAEQAAIQEQLIDIAKQRVEAETSLIEIEDQLSDSVMEVIDAEKEREELESRLNDLTDEEIQRYDELSSIVDPLSKEERALAEAYKETTGSLEELNGKQEMLTSLMEESDEATEQSVQSAQEYTEAIEEQTEELKKLKEALEQTVEAQVNSFEKMKEGAAIIKDELIANLEYNIEALENWADNMNTLVERGISDGLLQHLAEMGPEGAAQVQQFVDMTGEELEKADNLWEEAASRSIEISDSLATEYGTAGTHATQYWIDGAWQPINDGEVNDVITGIVDQLAESPEWERLPESAKNAIILAKEGMIEQIEEDTAPAEALANNLVDEDVWEEMPENIKAHIIAAKEAMIEAIEEDDEENPGQVLADNMVDSVGETLEERSEEVATATQEGLTQPIKDTINEQFQTSEGGQSITMQQYGINLITSLNQGINDTTQTMLLPTIQNMCMQAKQTIETQWGLEGTRFKVWYDYGMEIPTSMADGVRDGTSVLCEAVQAMCAAAVEAIDISGLASKIEMKLGEAFG